MPGDILPSEQELAKHFVVSISTIRAAISELVLTGILVRKQGSGTYVATHDFHRERYYFSNLQDMNGRKVLTTRVIRSIQKIEASAEIVSLLQLSKRARAIYKVEATLNVKHSAAAIMTILLPVWLFAKFQERGLTQTEENLYAIFQKLYGITAIRMNETVYAGTANTSEARLLGLKKGAPTLHINRVTFTYNDIPIEIRNRTFDGKAYQYQFSQDHFSI